MTDNVIGNVFKTNLDMTEPNRGKRPLTKEEKQMRYFDKNSKILNKVKKNPMTWYVFDMQEDNAENYGNMRTRCTRYRVVLKDLGFEFRVTYREGDKGFIYLLVRYNDSGMSSEEEQ